jgi:nickel/cobalt transporter (NiCoT) family protein
VVDSDIPNLVHWYRCPISFTHLLTWLAGMCLLDTADGALMMALYTSTSLARDTIAVLYYSIVLTVITIVVAIVIGVIQVLSLVRNVAEPTGKFWDGVEIVEDYYDVIGGAICLSFIILGSLSVIFYNPWRRYIDRRREENGDIDGGNREEQRLLVDSRHEEGDEES